MNIELSQNLSILDIMKEEANKYYSTFITGRISLTPEELRKCLGRATGVSEAMLVVRDKVPFARKREYVTARFIGMHILKNYTKMTLYDIGEEFGGRDHASVIHASKTVENLLDVDREFSQFYWEVLHEVFRTDSLKKSIQLSRIGIKCYRSKDTLIISDNPTYL